MKKLIAVLLVLAMVLSLAACGDKEGAPDAAYNNYLKLIGAEAKDDEPKETKEISFTVSDVQIITVEGNSIVLILDENQNIYHYDLSDGDYRASFLKQNVLIKATVDENNSIKEFIEIGVPEVAEPEVTETETEETATNE